MSPYKPCNPSFKELPVVGLADALDVNPFQLTHANPADYGSSQKSGKRA